ncbi:hypothetical protein GALMADRAFT_155664 [Galerina marginata CBS 339.88]|uniref:F-box domain-containing protein n=1 Tax=Galerina marginata (strain CBS 339.88) TaxID=685588 RepID=A0A067TAS6_GALM3|nr:hypothetical protein GALMADRAFT_155664 [Galerina marginata CBS 339.88]
MPPSTLQSVGQCSSASIFPDLPTELILQILQDLDNESLVQLSLTCRHLHFVSLDQFFSRANINTAIGWLTVTDTPPPQTLRALRSALNLQSLKTIYFAFTPDFRRLFCDMSDLCGLLARLPSIQSVTLQFGRVDNWAHDLLRLKTRCIEPRRWQKLLTGLIRIILDRSCVELQVMGLSHLSQLYIVSGLARPSPEGAGPGQRPPGIAGVAETSRRSNKEIPRTLPVKSESFFKRIFSGSRSLGTKQLNTSSSSSTDAPHMFDEPNDVSGTNRRTGVSLNLCPTPRELHFYRSNVLFQPPIYEWTMLTLKVESFNITTLSFRSLEVPKEVWAEMLGSLTLTHLKKFEICSTVLSIKMGVCFIDINDFLVRHSNITDLHLHTVEFPSSSVPVTPPVLPLLKRFTAHPSYINWILQNSVLESGTFQNLDSVTISAEFNLSKFNYNLFDSALQTVSRTRSTALTLKFISNQWGARRWFMKHVDLGIENSLLSELKGIVSLIISLSFSVEFHDDAVVVLPTWLHFFPKLEHVGFNGLSQETTSLLKDERFMAELATACPNLKTVTVQSEEFRLNSQYDNK